MILFETNRLVIKTLQTEDKVYFRELLSDPQIIAPIPQPLFSSKEIEQRFSDNLDLDKRNFHDERHAWGVFEKGNPTLVGLALFLTNNEKERELGYRFRPAYWGKGYGTELTRGMIDFCFDVLAHEKVTADVNIINLGSVKILEKFMNPVVEFFNERDNCTDRRYEIKKTQWKKRQK